MLKRQQVPEEMQDQRDHCDEYDDYDDVLDKLQPEYHKDYQHDYRCKAFKQRHGNTKKPKSCICIKITRWDDTFKYNISLYASGDNNGKKGSSSLPRRTRLLAVVLSRELILKAAFPCHPR